MSIDEQLRALPSVDSLLAEEEILSLGAEYGRSLIVEAVRSALAASRERILSGELASAEPMPSWPTLVSEALARLVQPTLQPAINATGVILHTNLGRAPLSADVLDAMQRVGSGYSNLEFDLSKGRRGSRYVHAEELLCRLTGAEAALLVNNNAAAVVLTLSSLAKGREVVVSRGELVEIGGGFRIPDVMNQSGAALVEVGTTNRTYVRDYIEAVGEETTALMRVHSSNFRTIGFVHRPELGKLTEAAHQQGLLMFDDLGSGTFLDTERFGLEHEPTVRESIAAGADVVTFSGDKLLGGPQAGIILGRSDLVAHMKRFPLTRALRVDKTTIAGIQANLLHYVKGEAETRIPIWQMIGATQELVRSRTEELKRTLGAGWSLLSGQSMVGGGSLPGQTLPTTLLALTCDRAAEAAKALRLGKPAVICRVQDSKILVDLRTVLPHQAQDLARRLAELPA